MCVEAAERTCHATAAIQAIQWTPIEPIGPVGAGLHTCTYDRLQRERKGNEGKKKAERKHGDEYESLMQWFSKLETHVHAHTHRHINEGIGGGVQGGIDGGGSWKIPSQRYLLTCSHVAGHAKYPPHAHARMAALVMEKGLL